MLARQQQGTPLPPQPAGRDHPRRVTGCARLPSGHRSSNHSTTVVPRRHKRQQQLPVKIEATAVTAVVAIAVATHHHLARETCWTSGDCRRRGGTRRRDQAFLRRGGRRRRRAYASALACRLTRSWRRSSSPQRKTCTRPRARNFGKLAFGVCFLVRIICLFCSFGAGLCLLEIRVFWERFRRQRILFGCPYV